MNSSPRVDELGPARVVGPQVCVGRDQVGIAIRTVASGRPSIRVRGHTGGDGDPVVAADRDDLWVPDGDAGDVVDRDRALVIGQPVRGCAAEARIARSRHPIAVGNVRSHVGITTRNLDPPTRAEQVRGPPVDDRAWPQSH